MLLVIIIPAVFALMFLFDFQNIRRRMKNRCTVYFIIAALASAVMLYCLFSGRAAFIGR